MGSKSGGTLRKSPELLLLLEKTITQGFADFGPKAAQSREKGGVAASGRKSVWIHPNKGAF